MLTAEQKKIGENRVKILKEINPDGVYDPVAFAKLSEEVFEKFLSKFDKATDVLSDAGIVEKPKSRKKKVSLDSSPTEKIEAFEADARVITPAESDKFMLERFDKQVSKDLMDMHTKLSELSLESVKIKVDTPLGGQIQQAMYHMLTKQMEMIEQYMNWTRNNIPKIK